MLLADLSMVLQVLMSYELYANLYKWFTLALFAYVGTAFAANVNWSLALKNTFVPTLSLDSKGLFMLIAMLGTTISPYLFFWQASREVEELRIHREEQPLKTAPDQAPQQLRRIKGDTYLGMAASVLIAFFIMVTAAANLNAQGQTDIQSAAQAV